MPYYHVFAEFEDKDASVETIFMDLMEADLKTRFLKPYKKGTSLISGNRVMPVTKMSKIYVIRTERESKAELLDLQKTSREQIDRLNRDSSGVFFLSLGSGYADADIREVGIDVTATYVTTPPGNGAEGTPIKLAKWVLTNAWGVAAGVAAAGIAWWFGWH